MSPILRRLLFFLAALQVADAGSCPNFYDPWFGGACFRIHYAQQPFENAVTECERDAAELASIHSAKENELIRRLVATWPTIARHQVWLGLRCNPSTRKYYWIDGSPLDYTNINTPCTSKSYGYLLDGVTGEWKAVDAYSYINPLCRMPKRIDDSCDGYEKVPGSATCISVKTEIQYLNVAELQCKAEHANIASIHDQETNDFILARARSLKLVNGVHIGLRSNATGAGPDGRQPQLAWSDATNVTYTNFAPGFPSDIFGHCGALETNSLNGRWMSSQCVTSVMPYVCGRPAPDTNGTVTPPGCPQNPYYYNQSEIVYSPLYPLGPGPLSCDFYLVAPERKHVVLQFADFELNECCDRLELFDGAFTNLPIATLSGKGEPGRFYYTAGYNILRMTLTTTDGRGVRGFKAIFKAV